MDVIIYWVSKPTANPLRDAGWRVNNRKETKQSGNYLTNTFIAHADSTEGTYSITVTIIHQKQIKDTYSITVITIKQKSYPTKNRHTATLKTILLRPDWRHPQTFTQNPKEKQSCDFPERVVQHRVLDLESEPPPMWSAARTSRLHV